MKYVIFVALALPVSSVALGADASPGSAHAAYLEGKYSVAIERWERMGPERRDDSANVELARSYFISGDLARAEATATRLSEVSPRNVDAILILGDLEGRKGDWRTAAVFYETATREEPGRAQAWLSLGEALLRDGKRNQAEQAFAEYRALLDR